MIPPPSAYTADLERQLADEDGDYRKLAAAAQKHCEWLQSQWDAAKAQLAEAVAAEREACAKVAYEYGDRTDMVGVRITAAIRARATPPQQDMGVGDGLRQLRDWGGLQMNDTQSFHAAIAANPRDPELWDEYARWLDSEGRPTWEREQCCDCHAAERLGIDCGPCNNTGIIDRSTLPAHQQPPHMARVVAWMLRMRDERWHGTEERHPIDVDKVEYYHRIGKIPMVPPIKTVMVPTFALLFDREEVCPEPSTWPTGAPTGVHSLLCGKCDGSGKRIIPGHMTQFADMLAQAGDPRAASVRGLSVCKWHFPDRWDVWCSVTNRASQEAYPTYADACREVIRRLGEIFMERCKACAGFGKHFDDECQSVDSWPCDKCHGLGEVARRDE